MMYKIYHVRESNLTIPKDEFTTMEVIKLSDVQTLEQRVKELEAELQEAKQALSEKVSAIWDEENRTLKAENARLRVALIKLLDSCTTLDATVFPKVFGVCQPTLSDVEQAQQALAPRTEGA